MVDLIKYEGITGFDPTNFRRDLADVVPRSKLLW